MHPDRLHWAIHLSCLGGVALATGCGEHMPQNNSPLPKRDINAVLRDHDKELLAIPGVVGVYVALLDDGKTPCLKVMLARKTASTKERSTQWSEAQHWYEKSLNTWQRIPNPGRISPTGFEASDPRQIARHLAQCSAELLRLPSQNSDLP